MIREQDSHLVLALDRLDWALTLPIRSDAQEWCDRLGRALTNLEAALASHAAWTESSHGPFVGLDDPLFLPLTATSRQVRQCRQEHSRFRRQVRGLRGQLQAVRRTVAGGGILTGPALARLLRGAGKLLRQLHSHRAAEQQLVSTHRPRRAPR